MKDTSVIAAARRLFARSACVAMACLGMAQAVTVNISYLEGTQPVAPDAITTLGPDLFGDKVNLFNGALEFEQTDTRLPGNNALGMAVTRRYTVGRPLDVRGQFGDWDLDTPRIGGAFARGWVTNNGSTNRCSGYSLPPTISVGTAGPGAFERVVPDKTSKTAPSELNATGPANPDAIVGFIASDYFQGVNISIPGQGSQEVLLRNPAFTWVPTDGRSYSLVTRGNWQVGCLPTIQNGAGEGFFAVTPDGVRYRFDWMASRYVNDLKKSGANIGRTDHFLMATEVTDRFGNWVRYSYEPTSPLLLRRIESSDGRIITVTNTAGRAAAVNDGTRAFTYGYDASGNLQKVIQPDGSRWTFSLGGMTATNLGDMGEGATCDWPGTLPPDNLDGTMTHPSGAVGTFKTMFVYLGRTYVDRFCKYHPNSTLKTIGAVYPRAFGSQALLGKSITGPGMLDMNWTYSYSTNYGWNPCTGCNDRRVVIVTDPGGSKTAHQFGIRWRVNEGQLLQVDEGWTGSAWLKSTVHRYRTAVGQNFPDQFGFSLLPRSDYLASRNRPQDQRVTTQQGTAFTWEVDESAAGFDTLARPLKVNQFSSLIPTKIRTEATEYEDNTPLWVLGQKKRLVELTSGREVERHEFSRRTALKSASFSFGLPTSAFAYRPTDGPLGTDGILETLYDAANRPIAFQNFMRGKPQRAVFADGSVASRVVNNLGNVAAETNEVNSTTTYTFDAMGRVASISYPTGDPVAYTPTILTFTQVPDHEYGLAPGHWRQTVYTGNGYRHRYLDALWRVRLERRHDFGNVGATDSFVETRYDADNRKAFESYPSRTFSLVDLAIAGKSTSYDGLDRVVKQIADSELGPLVTTTEYLTGFQRKVTNPRGFGSTQSFQAFDVPSEDRMARIDLADGGWVSIARDLFGKPSSISREGTHAGKAQQVTRSYRYDAHERLCKTVEPETGATVQGFDAAGNVAWRASGQAFGNATACEDSSIADSARVRFGYDARDRLTSTTYGDDSPGITRTYTPDGLLEQLSTGGTRWTYRYYNRRLLKSEQYQWFASMGPNEGWKLEWGVNTNGHMWSLTDPWGLMNYAPDALGRPTQISGYASNVTYHPNGAVAGYTLNNGIVHSLQQNLRGLPEIMRDIGVTHDVYSYDPNGNVIGIVDHRPDDFGYGPATRSMGYDGLDRLNVANGTWGAGTFDYDAIDNLRSSTVGGRTLSHHYVDGSNRLTSLSGSQNVDVRYDVNGNVIRRGPQAFAFDIGNRMRSAAGKANSYVYDGHGRRSQTYLADGNWHLYSYAMDGKLRFGYRSNQGHTRYVYLGDKLISETTEAATTYSHTDALGSPVAITNSIGAVQSRTRYEPYGATAAGTNPAKIGFTGHVNDGDTGLVYMQQRFYDPIGGQFLSVDPVTTDANTGSSFNRYKYANNNPYRFVDPDGRQACSAGGSYFCKVVELAGTGAASAAKAVDGTITGGHGIRFSSAMSSGNYGDAGIHLAAGVGHGLFNVVTLGEGAAATALIRSVAAKGASAYSVAFETAIPKLGLGTRPEHFKAANSALESAMKSDAAFARMTKDLGIAVPINRGTSPANWTWHHVPDRPGMMQLVPRSQHSWGSAQQQLLHPAGKGGFSLWGIDY